MSLHMNRFIGITSSLLIAAATTASGPVPPDESMISTSPGFTDQWGASVAFGDGFFAIGSPTDDDVAANAGSVSVIWFDTATGLPTMSTIEAPAGLVGNAAFGNVVAVSGNTLAVAAPSQDTGMGPIGAVYVYDVGPSVLTLEEVLQPSTLMISDLFAWDLDIQDDRIIVGAPGTTSGGGCVWIFDVISGDDWSSGAQVFLPGGNEGDGLGWAVALDQADANRFAASMPYADVTTPGDEAGMIKIFEYDPFTLSWSPMATIDQTLMPMGTSTEHLGTDLDFQGGNLIAGEYLFNGATGRAHLFNEGMTWSHRQFMQPAGSATILKHGWSVALFDDLAAVGAMHADFGLALEGAAYLYHADAAGDWNLIAELQSNGGGASQLGASMSLGEYGLLVGASGATETAAAPTIGHGNVQYWSTSRTPGCPSDVNMDGTSDASDISDLLTAWGACGDPDGCLEDTNDDGDINMLDLIDVLLNWGSCI
jgi:hypothetical protein